jgi:hypothetical protein
MNLQVRQIGLLALLFGTIVSVSLIWLSPAFSRAAHGLRNGLERIARHRLAVALTVAGSVLILRAALLPVWKIPIPSVPDEFSHLLLGDTLATGRLTNPAHPMWVHFETPYQLQQPTYASAYPPAQGMVLAAGEAITGQPWWGVWLSVGIMCAVFCWMFQQWLPPLWAMAAGIWVALQLGLFSYWMNSYWGGAVSAAGGALVIGSVARLHRGVTAVNIAILAAGMSVLGASRPYEGAVLAMAAVVYTAFDLRRRGKWPPRVRALLPGAAILLLFAAALSYYCWRVTGNPLELPQIAYIKQYAVTKAFVWQKSPPETTFRHAVLGAEMKSFQLEERQYDSRLGGFLWTLWKAMRIASFYLGPLLLVPLAMLPWLLRGRFRGAVFMAAASLTGILLTVFLELHYAAPMSGLLYLLTAQSLRILWGARRYGNPIGRFLVPAAPAVALINIVLTASPPTARLAHVERAQIIENLRRTPDRHLIVVRYGSPHQLADEWVYNDADIDGSPVVWARDMGPLNGELVRYFGDRRIWYLDADRSPPALIPYTDDSAGVARN